MKVAFYQLNQSEARRNAMFMQPEDVVLNYQHVYECIYAFNSVKSIQNDQEVMNFLVTLFMTYQDKKPKSYVGTSLSGTDIITLEGHGAYFCNTCVGWTKVKFNPVNRGKLIVMEGIDGCGKSSVLKMIEEAYSGSDILLLREPGSTKISEKIREILLDPENKNMDRWCEAYLYAASRAQLVQEVIKPALNLGKIVIVDRFIDSSLIYQGIGRNCGIEEIKRLNQFALDGLKAELTFLFDCPAETALNRRADRICDRIEKEDLQFFEKIREGYLRKAKVKKRRYIIIDATKPLEETNNEVKRILDRLI